MKIKVRAKHIISFLFVITVLFPLTIQFSHAFQKHEYSETSLENHVQAHLPINDCKFFHDQINYNTITFSSKFTPNEAILIEEKIITQEKGKESTSFFYRPSRAPPSLLFFL
ncbi:MAG: hypothetical protein HKP59_06195 [Lutibacter sp.]|uniref:hypothetical protein n=1 Tax=Lutibacter sp. TaxID=1925666 RepID=UPI001848653C|nr:hypothetical protein [Lutibacter sp.]MBT8317196.1 hypothetical protein [Lutibacter sp.]NNJ58055.1 hypothetical protein [Lutibacter sp.]